MKDQFLTGSRPQVIGVINIPLDRHAAILGKAGSGKSYAGRGEVETWLLAGDRVCVIDPTDVWWGLRLAEDGKSPGFPVVIFGGDHADLPLPPTSGIAMADIVAKSNTSVVLCVADMTVGERHRFFTDFAEALYRFNRAPLRLVIDEAHTFIPQASRMDPQSGRMLHAANNLISMGRARGFSVLMISQRPQKLHKDSLSQTETLVAMRLPAPQDRDAVKAWIDEEGDRSKAAEVLQSLPGLPKGQGWIWTPVDGRLERVTFPRISTYDSGRGFMVDDKVALTPIDIGTIKARLEEAQVDTASDAEKIRMLEAQIAKLSKKGDDSRIDEARVRAEGERSGVMKGFNLLEAVVAKHLEEKGIEMPALDNAINVARAELLGDYEADTGPFAQERPPEAIMHEDADEPPISAKTQARIAHDAENMGPAERKVLQAIIQFPGSKNKKIAVIAGYSPTSGGFAGAIGTLRKRGFIEGRAPLMPTRAGVVAAKDFELLPTGKRLVEWWVNKLEKAPRTVLQVLISDGNGGLTNTQLADKCNYSKTSGGFAGALAQLRLLGLIENRNGRLIASPHLFGR